jgi:hypothetical protein
MFLLTVILKQSPHCLQFHFDTLAAAESAPTVQGELTIIDDDYGQSAEITTDQIASSSINDLEKTMAAQEIIDIEKFRKDMRVAKRQQQEQSGLLTAARPNIVSN